MSGMAPLLAVRGLRTHFAVGRRLLPWAKEALVHAVDGIDFDIMPGTTFGLVGESGSGKSSAALSVLRLVRATAGSVFFAGQDLLALPEPAMRRLRRHMQIVFQDPYSSLNPRQRAGDIVRKPLDIHRIGTPGERARRVDELFEVVGLRAEQQRLYPHQFSGGQRQRIAIARAIATYPRFVVCDEPVSALDVAIQAQIINLLRRLQREFRLTYLFISHDLGVVREICDRVAVLYFGRIIEEADREDLFLRPLHPYTQALLAAVPRLDGEERHGGPRLIDGPPPDPTAPPVGCRFADRCPHAMPRCRAEAPALRRFGSHAVACHLVPEPALRSDTGRPFEETAKGLR